MTSEYIQLLQDSDGIVELVFDQPGQMVNTMGEAYDAAMKEALIDIETRIAGGGVAGVYVRSGKPGQFFAGGDIKEMMEMDLSPDVERKEEMFQGILDTKASLRKLETLGVPVAVGINGACLGGGYEIALACHYRIALPGVQVGLPEGAIGLMPGGGGTVRLTRLLGMQQAVTLISQGRRLKSEKAQDMGLVDLLVDDEEQMHRAAKGWILNNADAVQPWDRKDYQMPGGDIDNKANEGFIYFGPVNVMTNTKGLMPAQQAIFSCIVDSARVDFDTAQIIEARYFLSLLLDQTARNMMTTFFLQMESLNRGASRPAHVPRRRITRLGIIGAGQMGAGIAAVAAQKGIEVVLKDISQENADAGLQYVASSYEKNRRVSEQQAEEYLSRIVATDDYAKMADCELVIEAVFENRQVKAAVTKESEAVLGDDAIFASNTSALPITELAIASERAQNFIGMHFFSPAEKMPLVEIICGDKTSDETLAGAFDLAQQLGKTPIVVNDGPGFFTSRVISQTVSQGAEMVVEGINPVLIESAARDNGAPVGPLAAIDEISQETAYKNGLQAKADVEAQGGVWEENNTSRLMDVLVNQCDRRGKRFGGGYYEYPQKGGKYMWPGLKELYAADGYLKIPYQDIKDRLQFSQCLEAVRAMQDGVVDQVADGNIGSIMGIGFPAQTGGVFQAINAYGLQAFVDRSRELEARYGEVFAPPQLLLDRAASGQPFL